MSEALTVPQLNGLLKRLIEAEPALNDFWVRGEVSEWRRVASGHCYFSLKADDNSGQMIKCVMWRTQAERHLHNRGGLPKDGDAVEVFGALRLYENRSEYQVSVAAVQPVGLGLLFNDFERLRAQLTAEGIFDEARKRPLPAAIARIGIVTSADAAVFQDVQNVLRRRYPLAQLVLSSTPVQGSDAPPQIVKALARLNAREDIDVILVCRGGGSTEDLWCFNDERVARAIAGSRIPVVSGVGHETDFTLADFAADLRAPTPSAAAEIVTPDADALRADVRDARRRLDDAISDWLDGQQTRLNERSWALSRLAPDAKIERLRQRLDEWNGRMALALRNRLYLLRVELNGRADALRTADPRSILARGYAIVTFSGEDTRITCAQHKPPPPGTGITIQFHDGELPARIEDKNLHGQYKRTLF